MALDNRSEPACSVDDRRATLSRKIAEGRRALARGVTIGRAIELWTEVGEATAELTELAADRRQPRARRPWQPAPKAKMRVKWQRVAWTGSRPAGYGRDPGRR
jgi:hypothetical protein